MKTHPSCSLEFSLTYNTFTNVVNPSLPIQANSVNHVIILALFTCPTT
jgi:hypothetical protein